MRVHDTTPDAPRFFSFLSHTRFGKKKKEKRSREMNKLTDAILAAVLDINNECRLRHTPSERAPIFNPLILSLILTIRCDEYEM